MVGQSGLEPPTSRLSVVCSNQLSYWPVVRAKSALFGLPFGQPSSASLLFLSKSNPLRWALILFLARLWGPRRSPAKRVRWGKDEQRSERAFGFSRKRTIRSLLGRGGDERNRTADLLLARQALSQLSYTPTSCAVVIEDHGVCPLN